MKKNMIVINSSERINGNSEILVSKFVKGARENNNVEVINLRELNYGFCKGCLACQSTKKCILKDDISNVIDKVCNADILVFATPLYYYSISGQLKTFLDRMNPLYVADYKYREVYLFTACADSSSNAIDVAINEINGWISCFNEVELKGTLCGTSSTGIGDINKQTEILKKAYEIGRNIR